MRQRDTTMKQVAEHVDYSLLDQLTPDPDLSLIHI